MMTDKVEIYMCHQHSDWQSHMSWHIVDKAYSLLSYIIIFSYLSINKYFCYEVSFTKRTTVVSILIVSLEIMYIAIDNLS